MASRNKKVIIPIPLQGLREDVSDMVATSDMVTDGENVIAVDQTIRPRPASDIVTFNETQNLGWVLIYNPSDSDDERMTAVVVIGTTLLAQFTDPLTGAGFYKLKSSDDWGLSWADISDLGTGAPLENNKISGFALAGNYLYACLLYTSPSPRDRTRSRMPSSA